MVMVNNLPTCIADIFISLCHGNYRPILLAFKTIEIICVGVVALFKIVLISMVEQKLCRVDCTCWRFYRTETKVCIFAQNSTVANFSLVTDV